MSRFRGLVLVFLALLLAVSLSNSLVAQDTDQQISDAALAGHNAWMLTSTALVLFMTTPGLALFYSGLVRRKNVLSVMMQCLFLSGLMTVLWCLYGYSLVQWLGAGLWARVALEASISVVGDLVARDAMWIVARGAAESPLALFETNARMRLLDVAHRLRSPLRIDIGASHEESPHVAQSIARPKVVVAAAVPQHRVLTEQMTLIAYVIASRGIEPRGIDDRVLASPRALPVVLDMRCRGAMATLARDAELTDIRRLISEHIGAVPNRVGRQPAMA